MQPKKKKKEKYQAINKKKNSSQCFVMSMDVAFKIFNSPFFFSILNTLFILKKFQNTEICSK